MKMKAYFTLLLMSLALCLMAQSTANQQSGVVTSSNIKLDTPYTVSKGFFNTIPTAYNWRHSEFATYHTFAYQNKYNKRWEAHMEMKDSIPRIELYGEWRLQIEAGKSYLVPVGYFEPAIAFINPDTLATYKLRYINELTTMEQYAALESLQDYIFKTLGADKVPESSRLLSLVGNKRAFEYSGRRVLIEGMTVDYYNYTDAPNLIEALR